MTESNFWWGVNFMVIPKGKQHGDEYDKDFWVQAPSTCDAVIAATELFKKEIEAGDLIHMVHIGAPRRKPPVIKS